MLSYFTLQIILKAAPGIGNSLEEQIIIGVMTSLAISMFFFFRDKIFEKKEFKQQEEKRQKQIEIKKKTEEEIYYDTLKKIIRDTGTIINFNYDKTVELLLNACNPKNFIEPYQPEKLKIAVELYSELNKMAQPYDKAFVRVLRKRSNELLGICLPSEETFLVMERILNPKNFVDKNFDEAKLLASNKAYQYVLNNKSDLRKMEQLAYKIELLQI